MGRRTASPKRKGREDLPRSGALGRFGEVRLARPRVAESASGSNPMETSREYTRLRLLRQGPYGPIHSAVRVRDSRRVVLKEYRDRGSRSARERAHRELDALHRARGPGVVSALDVIHESDRSVLVLERVSGVPLSEVAKRPLSSTRFLELAVQLASALTRVHSVRLIHGSVSPAHVLVDPSSLRVHLVDFSLARPLGSAADRGELQAGDGPGPGDLRYSSPEQTGRMDRGIDSRSDLYALGATLYFALTGQPPFPDDDELSLTHAHLARKPTDPLELRPELPPTLARIVMRLLQKMPEERYQMAGALQRDLTRCLEGLERSGSIPDDFPLGSVDAPYCPIFSGRLYGREEAVGSLLAAFDEAAAGQPVVLQISGGAGMGKSSLVQQLRPAVTRSRGYLIPGEYEQQRRDRPYRGLAQALEALVRQRLVESDKQLECWSAELGSRLGSSAGALVELVPDLGFVLEDVPVTPTLGPFETRVRLALAVQRLIQTVAKPEHPLVVFLDSMQWADHGSWDLLSDVLRQADGCALLLICAYRDGVQDVGAGHPLAQFQSELRERGIRTQRIALGPLDEPSCAEMLADALGREPQDMRALAACVGRKTGNVPFLIQQFVYHMYDEGLMQFDPQVGWSWDGPTVEAAEIPEGAVGLLTARVFRLPAEAAEVIKLASCTGGQFSLDMLGEIGLLERDRLERAAAVLCDEGLIAASAQGLQFTHDRIREAVRTLVPEEQRARLHTRAAEFLLGLPSSAQIEERIFEIADHLSAAAGSGQSFQGDGQFVDVNLRAARRALRSGAGATALQYCQTACDSADDALWDAQRDLCFDLFVQAADAAHACLEFDQEERYLARLGERDWPRVQRVQVLARLIRSSSATRPRQATADLSLALLRQFGIRWSRRPSRIRLAWELLRTDWSLWRMRERGGFVPCPPQNVDQVIHLVVVQAAGQVLSMISCPLVLLAAAEALRVYCRFGTLTSPCFAMVAYGSYQMRFASRRTRARRIVEDGRALIEKQPSPYDARAELIRVAYSDAWVMPRHSLVDALRRVGEMAYDMGDFEFACLSDAMRVAFMGLTGFPLADVQRERERVDRDRYAYGMGSVHRLGDRVCSILSEGADVEDFCRELNRSEEVERELQTYTTLQLLVVLVTLGQNARAFAEAEQLCERAYSAQIGTQVVDFAFLRGVAAGAVSRSDASSADRRRARRALRRSLRDLRHWAHPGSDFTHMYDLLRAERQWLRRNTRPALALYAEAARGAGARGHRHHVALAWERRAELLFAEGRATEAWVSLRQALRHYGEWGAVAKVEAIRARIEDGPG